MLSAISKFWNTLTNIGITPMLKDSQAHKVRLLNQLAIPVLLLQMLINLQNTIVANIEQLLIGMFIVFSTAMILLFNHYRRYTVAALIVTSFYPLIIVGMSIMYGTWFNVSYAYMAIILAIMVLHKNTSLRLVLILWSIGLYLVGDYYTQFHEPILKLNFTYFDRHVIFLCTIICLVIVNDKYVKDNEKQKERLREMLTSLEIKNEELNLANKELERFAFIASHDLKTPLRTIVSYLDLVERKIRANHYEDIEKYIAFAQQGGIQMNKLITEVLEYSKLNLADSVEIENVDLNEVVSANVAQLHSLMQDKNANVIINRLPVIKANRLMMSVLFQNIIENALKYNTSEEPIVEVISVKDSQHLHITFKDNGIGIPKAYQNNVFEMFTRLHNDNEYSSTGMGLAVCKKIIERFQGKIWVESEENQGASFHITIPFAVIKAENYAGFRPK